MDVAAGFESGAEEADGIMGRPYWQVIYVAVQYYDVAVPGALAGLQAILAPSKAAMCIFQSVARSTCHACSKNLEQLIDVASCVHKLGSSELVMPLHYGLNPNILPYGLDMSNVQCYRCRKAGQFQSVESSLRVPQQLGGQVQHAFVYQSSG